MVFIKLLPHQEQFLNYSQNQCYNKKGYLLFHNMGTGKTGIALSWIMNYIHKNVYILLPKGLELVWKNEKKKFGVKKKLNLITFKEFWKNPFKYKDKINNNILIIDESHKICEYFYKQSNLNLKSKILQIFFSCFRVLLLSGTPLMYDVTDLSLLVNITTGKNILPYDKNTFIKKYAILDKKKSRKINKFSHNHNSYLRTYKNLLLTYTFFRFNKISNKLIKINADKLKLKNTNSLIISKLTNLCLPVIYNSYTHYRESDFKNEIKNYNIENFYKYDFKKIIDNTSQYISYFSFNENKQIINLEKKFTIVEYEYNLDQNIVILELATNNLTNKSAKLLNLIDNENFFSLAKTIKTDKKFIDLGRKCSNISDFYIKLINNKSKITYNEIFGYSVDKSSINNSNIFLDRNNLGSLNQKYQFIIKQLLKFKEKTLFYSNYYKEGFKILSVVLNYLNIKHYILDISQTPEKRLSIVNRFNKKDNKINIILFHPEIYEGISLFDVKHLHILEPISINIIREQLIARCIRYNSKQNTKIKHILNIYDHLFRQAILVPGVKNELKSEIQYVNQVSRKNLNINFIKINNDFFVNNKNSLWKKNKIKYLMALIDVFYNYSSNFISPILKKEKIKKIPIRIDETAPFLQEQANNRSGKHKELLNHLDNLLKSNNGKNEIFDLYNHMYTPKKIRNLLLLDPDYKIYLKSLKTKKNIEGIINNLKIKDLMNNNDINCLQRNCKIWKPFKNGNCHRLNKFET